MVQLFNNNHSNNNSFIYFTILVTLNNNDNENTTRKQQTLFGAGCVKNKKKNWNKYTNWINEIVQ